MKGFAMLGAGKTGWIEKARPTCGALDAIVRPIAVSPCTSDVHTVWEGALGERKDMILGHEAVGEVVEVGSLVRDFKPGDRVIVTAITPDWGSEEAQRGFAMHSGGMLAGWKFSNFKDGVFAEFFHVNEADANMARLPDDLDPGTACRPSLTRRSWPISSSEKASASLALAPSGSWQFARAFCAGQEMYTASGRGKTAWTWPRSMARRIF